MSTGALLAAGVSFAVALAISATLTPLVRAWARRRAFVDEPTGPVGHKTHGSPMPLGGGVAIVVAVLLPTVAVLLLAALRTPESAPARWLSGWAPQWPHWMGGVADKLPAAAAILAGAIALHAMGLLDDRRPLSAPVKLAVQTAIALALAAGFGIRAGEALGPAPAVALTTLWIVGVTNAFNFLDNMDGLAAGVAALTGALLAASSLLAGQVFVPCLLLLVSGAAAGFLLHNFPPASIFMGDAGSLVLGYLLAVGAVLASYYDPSRQRTPFGVLVPLVVFAVPLYDITSVVLNRYRRGASIFASDHHHFSHRLVRLGFTRTAAVLVIYLATAATALPAMLLPHLHWPGASLVVLQCLCVLALIAVLESRHGPGNHDNPSQRA